jgi:pyrroline-5-carboxylate reductase
MTFGFLGFGKMASALVQGMLQAGVCQPEQILVINRHPETIKDEVQQYGLVLAASTNRLTPSCSAQSLPTRSSSFAM